MVILLEANTFVDWMPFNIELPGPGCPEKKFRPNLTSVNSNFHIAHKCCLNGVSIPPVMRRIALTFAKAATANGRKIFVDFGSYPSHYGGKAHRECATWKFEFILSQVRSKLFFRTTRPR